VALMTTGMLMTELWVWSSWMGFCEGQANRSSLWNNEESVKGERMLPVLLAATMTLIACRGEDDECKPALHGWYDRDGDGFGGPDDQAYTCGDLELENNVDIVDDTGDCDDGDAAVNPGATEICNGADDDCDGAVDEDATDGGTWYADADGDGYGDAVTVSTSCEQPEGMVEDATDCDDADPTTFPNAEPGCDGLDHDCDGFMDNDADGDDHADEACGGDDCDDSDDNTYPLAPEVCEDGLVNDCLGSEAEATQQCWEDYELSRAQAKIIGDAERQEVGGALSGAGDVDGDGLADLLIGAGGYDGERGAAGLFLGPVSGTLGLSAADALLHGEAETDFASTVSAAGDLDGDGFDDLLIGASGEESNEGAGAAYVVLGPITGEADLADVAAKLLGEEACGGAAGTAVAGAGDVDGDGLDDILIGDSRECSVAEEAGAAYLVLGSQVGPAAGTQELSDARAKLLGIDSGARTGSSVAGPGDVNGDGLADLFIGAHNADGLVFSSGAAYLVLGPVSGERSLGDADASLVGESQHDDAGIAVAGAGDMDGDGLADLLIGAPEAGYDNDEGGLAYLVLGAPSGTVRLSEAAAVMVAEAQSDKAGNAVAGAGDADGDGWPDLLVGAYYADKRGTAYLVLGPVTGTVQLSAADAEFLSEAQGDHVGCAVAGAGDIDGDGDDELLVGAESEDEGGLSAGAAYLLDFGGGY